MMPKYYPTWWKTACLELSEKDAIMKNLIELHDDAKLSSIKNPFYSLSKSIVGQQISVQAADAIWKRIKKKFNVFNPSCYCKVDVLELRELGLSERKASYLINLSFKLKNDNNFNDWKKINDKEIYEKLIMLKGIGPWSIKMFLIFCLNRPDIFSLEDIGLIKALGKNYFNGNKPNLYKAEKIALSWHPWRTVAAWYLWRSIDPEVVAY